MKHEFFILNFHDFSLCKHTCYRFAEYLKMFALTYSTTFPKTSHAGGKAMNFNKFLIFQLLHTYHLICKVNFLTERCTTIIRRYNFSYNIIFLQLIIEPTIN